MGAMLCLSTVRHATPVSLLQRLLVGLILKSLGCLGVIGTTALRDDAFFTAPVFGFESTKFIFPGI